ncbi:hypothetical protein [Bosea sp. PAMC 26642]|uniref:hypothetical protein n=1 Tax=Bosea sp. (strain PAMC 26642) TaxID=1792307 RepID=UPI003FA4D3D4
MEQFREPGLEVGQLFRRVGVEVNKKTNGRQTPELSVSLQEISISTAHGFRRL